LTDGCLPDQHGYIVGVEAAEDRNIDSMTAHPVSSPTTSG
jgi:hypothetical protein